MVAVFVGLVGVAFVVVDGNDVACAYLPSQMVGFGATGECGVGCIVAARQCQRFVDVVDCQVDIG